MSATSIDAASIEGALSTPERLCIATAGEHPVGFVFVARTGVRTVDLSVCVKNLQAIALYEWFGFGVIPKGTTVVLANEA